MIPQSKNLSVPAVVAGLACLLAVALPASASGTYTGRLPQPVPGQAVTTEQERAYYAYGQRLFTGKIKLTSVEGVDATEQRRKLETLQKRLPARVAAKRRIVNHAGKLTPEQLQALIFYVQRRYAQ